MISGESWQKVLDCVSLCAVDECASRRVICAETIEDAPDSTFSPWTTILSFAVVIDAW